MKDNTLIQTTPRFINLRERREALHVTQAEMAQILEVSRLTYINYEKDFNKIPIGKYLRAEASWSNYDNNQGRIGIAL